MLSSVVTRRPATSSTGSRQDIIGSPSTSTVQLPQPPCRQPSLTAVWPSWLRRTDWSVVIGRTMTSTSRPPSSKVTIVDAIARPARRGAASLRRAPAARAPGRRRAPTIRRRYQSVAMPSVNGSHSGGRGRRGGDDVRRRGRCPTSSRSASRARIGMRPDGAEGDARVGDRRPVPGEAYGDRDHGRRVGVLAAELDVGGRTALVTGTSIATSSSSAARRLVMKPVKKSASGRTRSPRVLARITLASSASRATATSPPGGGVNRLPPTVPMLRIDQLAVLRAASLSIGTSVLLQQLRQGRRGPDRAACRPRARSGRGPPGAGP